MAPMNVVVVGGGVGALELILGLRKLAEDRTRITLIAPDQDFRYRPAAVAVPYGQGAVYGFPLADVARTSAAEMFQTTVVEVDPRARWVRTADGREIPYDAVVIACGARRQPVIDGAIPFRGEEDIPAMDGLLEELGDGRVRSVAFALPRGASWALPLYELALLTATHLARTNVHGVALSLVTPEQRPLAQFGGGASDEVAALLAAGGIEVHTATYPVRVYGSVLMLVPAKTLTVDRVVSMPRARGVPIDGLPHDFEGFLPTDLFGRVSGVEDVYAVGDITNQPIKQGGIAAQQADVVAQLLAKTAGAPVDEPTPHRPVLRGLLLTGDEPRYLESKPAGGHGAAALASREPLWWPGGKIAGRHLGSYLAAAERH